jgi:hypothetical protein
MDFFSRSRLAPEVADDAKQSFIDSHKANVVGTGAFQYNREIVVRRIPCEGLVSNILCACLGQTAIKVMRSCPSNEERAYALHHFTFQNDILAALQHRFRG